jgi:hypothetical protein
MDYDQYYTRLDIALQDSFLNTHIGLLIVMEAQVALSENTGGIFNLIIGKAEPDPLSTLEEPLFSLASKN